MVRVRRNHKDHPVPSPLQWAGTPSTGSGCSKRYPTNTSRDGEAATSLGNVSQCLTTLTTVQSGGGAPVRARPAPPPRCPGSDGAATMSKRRLQQLGDALGRSARHFNRSEVECLIKLFDSLVAKSRVCSAAVGFDRNMFRDVLHCTFGMTDDILMDRDCFEVYDLNRDGYISREEMFQLLKNSLLKQPSEEDPNEGVKDLVDIVMKKMDYDHDGRLSFMDFEKAVRDENLLLEAFGPCLPDIKSSMAFEEKTFQETRKL
ncbi:calaxin isoform X2 [Cuculus canorus]|uniref:calaxin isoform X2 n=1 Tax=Cuculus canorus TaxID=55661 RepID=UPI0023AB0E75|nr:calaxin isoform X2 [Cuculus canorus]